jgi:hypothetical protein
MKVKINNSDKSLPTMLSVAAVLLAIFSLGVFAQIPPKVEVPTQFHIGERISYEIHFEKFKNVAYAETEVVSRGVFAGRDAVELRGKFKTQTYIAEKFSYVDEERTTFVSADTGIPIYSTITKNNTGLPEVTNVDNRTSGSTALDLLSVIYKMRQSAGTGSFSIVEDGKTYTVSFQTLGAEKVSTVIGDLDTSILAVTSDYFTERGFSDIKLNLSMDQDRVPIAFSAKTGKSEFRGLIASLTNIEPETEPVVVPTPNPTPVPVATPRPTPTPEIYQNDMPLSPDLAFKLGERLEYKITKGGQQIGLIALQARERRQIFGKDSLLLTATITGIDQANEIFKLNDSIKAQVDPYTLTPRSVEIAFNGSLRNYNGVVLFDPVANAITINGKKRIDSPVGTHNIISLLYAMRSFNLKRSSDPQSPINDTRVAVFWDDAVTVFTLRPSNGDLISVRGEKISAQLISVTTGEPKLNALNIRVWLTNETPRVPVRIAIGGYQFDLDSQTNLRGK